MPTPGKGLDARSDYKYMPTDIPTTADWVHFSFYWNRGCAIDEAGQVHCFGDWDHDWWYMLDDALALR